MNKVYFLTLGCSKNEVDSENMMSILDRERYSLAKHVGEANIIVVNTCGFIDSAKEESIETILEAAEQKKEGECKKLLLAGCLAQRYSKELMDEIPEIDGIIGTGNVRDLNTILDEAMEDKKPVKIDNLNSDYIEGLNRLSYGYSEYVKISEGCNNNCTYCIIPKLRGKNRSRKIEDIYNEVSKLAAKGTREVILIAQNTTDYGIDLYGEYALAKLIKKLSDIEDLEWIRVMYLYPDHFTDELIDEFIHNEKLVKYVDIPLQHVSDNVLKAMGRKTDYNAIKKLISNLRDNVPGIVLRTTFIIGFPGETEKDFQSLVDFIEIAKFDKLGAFTYSREEGTVAYSMENQIEETVKESRLDKLMTTQKDISEELMSDNIGRTLKVLVEEYAGENTYTGRSYMDAPEIDGVVYINTEEDLAIGEFVFVKITDSLEYDLIGEINEQGK